MTNYKQQAIEYCLNTFNYTRVLKVMEHVEWRWATSRGLVIPNMVDLVNAANERLNTAWDKRTTCESGGIRAVYVPPEMNDDGELEPPGLELMFILTETQSY